MGWWERWLSARLDGSVATVDGRGWVWSWDEVRGESFVVRHTEDGGGVCAEKETDEEVPSAVLLRKDEGEEEEEVAEEGDNVETGGVPGRRCRQRGDEGEDKVVREELKKVEEK